MNELDHPRGTPGHREDRLQLKRAYREEHIRERMGSHVRLGALAVFVINSGFIWLDHYACPEHFGEFLAARMALNAVLLWCYLRLSQTNPIAGQWSVCLATGALLLFVVYGTNPPTSGYYVGLVLFLVGIPVVLPLRAFDAAAVSGFFLAAAAAGPHLAGIFSSGSSAGDAPGAQLGSEYVVQLCFLAAAGLCGTASAYAVELARFRDFVQRRDLESTRDELRELDRTKSRFTANVHHELRTPLTLVLAPLEAILAGEFGTVSEQQRPYLETIRVNAQRLLKLINSLLDLSKIETHELRLQRRPLNIGRVVADLVAGARPLAERKQIRVDTSGLDELPVLNADLDGMEKVLLNLLGNALKFTDPGGCISILGSAEGDSIHLVVSDDGVGIPENQLERIFDRFAQVDGSATRRHEGTGIGLALARELVELHGGRIWAQSAGARSGSEFHVVLPLGEADTAQEDSVSERSAGPESWWGALDAEVATGKVNEGEMARAQRAAASSERRMRVLVVEDNDGMRNFLAAILGREYQVETARNGREGLEAARASRPDMVVTDIMMPEMSGTDLCRALQEDPRTRGTPVVLLTAKADREMRVEGLELGARDYVTKPFHPQELLARVRGIGEVERLQRELSQRNEVLKSAVFELKETQVQLVQAERLAAVGELAAGVAHEVNNPVNFAVNSLKTLLERLDDVRTLVVALAEVAPDDPTTLNERLDHVQDLKEKLGFADLAADLEELAAIATEGLERTHRLVGDLQDFARPGSHAREPVDVREGLAATIRLMRAATRDAGALVESEFDLELPPVKACAGMLNQTFLNLLKNATEALEGRGGTIRVTATRDRNESENRDEVVITIADDGPGIAPQIRERLFEPFTTTKETGRGAGLGLSVCRRILDELGGSLDLRPADGEESTGATFEIRLPVLKTATETTEAGPEEPPPESGAQEPDPS